MGTEPRMRSLLSVSLLLLSFSSSSTSKLPSERNDGCTESSPFAIRNQSPKAKQPYLTLNVKDGSLSGGKLKKGKPRRNQIWTWLNCPDGDFLSNRAEGQLLSVNKNTLNVVDSLSSSSAAAWIYDSELGTLRDVQSKKYVRLIKKKSRVAMAKKLRLMKKGPEKGKPWGWFRWTLEFFGFWVGVRFQLRVRFWIWIWIRIWIRMGIWIRIRMGIRIWIRIWIRMGI